MAGVLAMSATVCADALAQRNPASVTIYGVADAGIVRSSNQNGQSNVYEKSGALSASRIGFKGTEDLGGGTEAVFMLESGFDIDTGAQSDAAALFNRQAWVGLVDRRYGSVLLGRHYTPYSDMVGGLGPSVDLGGQAGAHPGDIDNLDTITHINNSIKYISPEWRGPQMSVLAGTGEQAGHNGSGASYSVAVKYDYKDWKFALGYQDLKNTDTPGTRGTLASAQINTSSVNTGYRSADQLLPNRSIVSCVPYVLRLLSEAYVPHEARLRRSSETNSDRAPALLIFPRTWHQARNSSAETGTFTAFG
jgi:predicted porin